MESRALDGPPERPPHPARVGPAPIDAVYTWVNGSDPAHCHERAPHAGAVRAAGGQRGGPLEEQRRAAPDSLRSLETFAPWIRAVHIVTNGQAPAWLDLGNPRVRLVTHAEIFRWPEDLPTFNSVAIETHLHRIPGLAERFVYFNDDTFLGAAWRAGDFFTADGRLCVRFRHEALPCNEGPAEVSAADRGAANANELLAFQFGPGRYHYAIHQARPLTRTLFEDAHRRWPEITRRNFAARFRSTSDVAMCYGVLSHYALRTDRAVAMPLVGRFCRLTDDVSTAVRELAAIERERPKMFCLNNDC